MSALPAALIADLEARGYLVLACAPGQVFRLVAFPHPECQRIAPDWIAVHERTSGFTELEAFVIASDRGGTLIDGDKPA